MEQIAGYVYVVFSEAKYPVCVNYGDWSTRYETEKEIIVIVDNEDKAKEIVKENMESFGQDDRVKYYYEMWEVMHA